MNIRDLLWELQDTYLDYDVSVKILVNGVKYDLERTYEEDYTIGCTNIVLVAKEIK